MRTFYTCAVPLVVLLLLATADGFPPTPYQIAKGLGSTIKGGVKSGTETPAPQTNNSPIETAETPEPGTNPIETANNPVEPDNSSEDGGKSKSIAKKILASGKETVQQGKQVVVNATKDVADVSKDVAVASKDAVVTASKEVANATKEVIEAGKDLVSPDDVCYGKLGCFSMSSPWFTLLRPLPTPHTPESIDTQFYLYTRRNRDRYTVPQGDGLDFSVDGSGYDGRKETFFITHGFSSNGNNTWLSDMKDAILKRYDGNVFLVDWGKGAALFNYFQVASNTRVVGATLARFGKYLIEKQGADPSRFHIIGHSLGAQISSYAAKNITNVAKLTALDPAQPAFEGYDKAVRLDVSDANFVQVIHTSSRPFIPLIGLGMIQAYGHVDFYMNGGWNQPGCTLPPKPNITSFLDLATVPVEVISNFISCPHGRSSEFLIATLAHDNCTFWGHRASVASKVATVLSGTLLAKRLISTPVNDCSDDKCSPLGFDAIHYPGRGSFSVATTGHGTYCVPEPDVDSRMRQFRGLKPRASSSEGEEKNKEDYDEVVEE